MATNPAKNKEKKANISRHNIISKELSNCSIEGKRRRGRPRKTSKTVHDCPLVTSLTKLRTVPRGNAPSFTSTTLSVKGLMMMMMNVSETRDISVSNMNYKSRHRQHKCSQQHPLVALSHLYNKLLVSSQVCAFG